MHVCGCGRACVCECGTTAMEEDFIVPEMDRATAGCKLPNSGAEDTVQELGRKC